MPKYTIIDLEDRWNTEAEDEWLWWPRVQWIDPGVVSGVAVLWFDPIALLARQPLRRCLLALSEMYISGPEDGVNGQANRFLRMHRSLNQEVGLAVGCESFVPLQFNQSWEFLAPVRMRSKIEFGLSRTAPVGQEEIGDGIPLNIQSPSDAITSITNKILRDMGLYTPGPDHINDAKRHAILWLRKLRAGTPAEGRARIEKLHGVEPGWWEAEE